MTILCLEQTVTAKAPRDGGAQGRRFRPIAVLTLLSAALLLLGLWPRELWSTDEPVTGAIVQEMLTSGKWLVPHLNGAVYPDKPPLYYWISALPAWLTGTLTPLWLRLPAVLSAIGCLWLTHALAVRLLGRSAGMPAALILATSPLFVVGAQIARMDMLLTFFVTAAFYCVVRGLQDTPSRRWFSAVYPLAGLAFLTKGLIGPVIIVFMIGSLIAWQRDWRLLARLNPDRGLLLAAAVALPWLIPAVLQEGSGYAVDLLIKQSMGRAIHSFAHDRPFYYYLYMFPLAFMPWTLFLPVAFQRLWRERSRLGWRAPFLLSWTAGLFLFFSAVSGKLVLYLLPLFPAFAILVAGVWDAWLRSEGGAEGERTMLWFSWSATGFFPAALLVVGLTGMAPPQISPRLLYGAAGAIALASILAFTVVSRSTARSCLGAILATVILALGLTKSATGTIDAAYSPKTLGRFLQSYEHQAPSMATYRIRSGLFNFYAERRLENLTEPAEARRFLDQTDPVLCILRKDDVPKVWPDGLPARLYLVRREAIGRFTYVVLTNAPDAPDQGRNRRG